MALGKLEEFVVPVIIQFPDEVGAWPEHMTQKWALMARTVAGLIVVGMANQTEPDTPYISLTFADINAVKATLLGLQAVIKTDDRRYAEALESKLLAEEQTLRNVLATVTGVQTVQCSSKTFCNCTDVRARKWIASIEIADDGTQHLRSGLGNIRIATELSGSHSWISIQLSLPQAMRFAELFLDAAHCRSLRDSILAMLV